MAITLLLGGLCTARGMDVSKAPRPRRKEENWEDLQRFLGLKGNAFEDRLAEIRLDLVRIFKWRGCGSHSEDLAHRTLARVCRKCGEPNFAFAGEQALYFYGAARFVFLEWIRKRPKTQQFPESFSPPDPAEPESELTSAMNECLEHCLKNLGQEKEELVLSYYQGEGATKIENRRRLATAQQGGGTSNKLRLRIHRIRNDLRICMSECLSYKGFSGFE